MTQPAYRWARIEQLFHEAQGVAAGEREAWLAAQCGSDDDLRREVASLLASDAPSGDTIARAVRSAVSETAKATMPPATGRRVGPYRLLREIGRGGMGSVYLAEREDADFRQQVAVKLLRGVVEPDRIHRLRAERRILAGLEHPNIARLLDGGTIEGLPYIVMEYVDGVPIDRYCEKQQLTMPERLRLFCEVCDAVDHAHRSLVVHRDIKPSNILVTAGGVPKLLDFGIAKLLDESGSASAGFMTGTMIRMFTPEYACPEQIRGDRITTASDVYSLGVLLYELLTGSLPFRFKTLRLEEVERVVCGEEPRKPSTIVHPDTRRARQLAGDLDTIVLTALNKEPGRRYLSAAQMAEDIRRFLENRPITARPVTWTYRTTRFIKRNRWPLAAAAAVLVAIVGSSVVLAVQAARLQRERDTAEQVVAFMTDLFNVSDPGESRGNTITAREILDRGAERIGTDLKDQPEVQARLLDAMGQVYTNIGLYDRAVAMLQPSLQLRQGLNGGDGLAVSTTMIRLANALRERGKVGDAEPLVREALEIRRRLSPQQSVEIAGALNALGLIEQARGRWNEAIPLFEEAVTIWRARNGPDHPQVAMALHSVSGIYRDAGDFAKAEQAAREALRIRRKALGDGHPLTASSVTLVAQILDARGEDAEAEVLLREALATRQKVLEPGHHLIYQSMNNLASVLHDQGKYAEAEPMYRAAIDGATKWLGPHAETAMNINNLATLMEDAGRYPEAEQYYRESLALRRQVLGADHPVVARSLNNLARFFAVTGRPAEALSAIDEALAIRRTRLGADHLEVTNSMSIRAQVLGDLGRLDEAESLLKETIARFEKQLPAGHMSTGAAKGGLAKLLLRSGRAGEAEPLAREAQAIRAKQLPTSHWMRAQSDALLGAVLSARGNRAEGGPLLQTGVEIITKALPAGDYRVKELERLLAAYGR